MSYVNLRNCLTKTLILMASVSLCSALSAQSVMTLYTPASGDAGYTWNSRYAGEDYTDVGSNSISISRSFYSGFPSDTQHTVGIFMIPISPLAGGTLFDATLHLSSLGFSTWYHYGSANLGWLNTSVALPENLSGNVVTDGIGPLAKSLPNDWTIYNSGTAGSGDAQNLSFNVTTQIQDDLDAGRAFSTFVVSASRDTGGSISAAESGSGPYLVALTSIPEPRTYALLLGMMALGFVWLHRRRQAV